MSVTIFHCADIHLDTPFSLSLRRAEQRNSELRSAFRNAVMYARGEKAQLFFIAGDLFDSRYVSLDTAELLINELRSFPECRFFVSPGNHDPYDDRSPYALLNWPDNVHIFREKERVSIDDLGVDVYGCGYTSGSMETSPVTGYPERDPSRINILVCHGTVGMPLSKDGPILLSEIESSGFDYIALGHIHRSEGVKSVGGVSYAYPGCIEGRGFDELGYKGALFGTVSKGEVKLKGVRMSLRRFETAQVLVDPHASKREIVEAVTRRVREFGSDTALRIELEGEMPAGVIITNDDLGNLTEGPYYLEIRDNTVPALELTGVEEDATLKGVFYRDMKKLIEESREQRRIALLALRYGLSALADRKVIDFEEAE